MIVAQCQPDGRELEGGSHDGHLRYRMRVSQSLLLHLDCPSGMAGDMFLGACLHLGLPLDLLVESVAALSLEGVTVEAWSARRHGIEGQRFRVLWKGLPVDGPESQEGQGAGDGDRLPHRDLTSISALLRRSTLPAPVRERSLEWFHRLAEVEAKVHGIGIEDVHFHEVGAVDSIVDIVGGVAAVEYLSPERVTCSPIVVGGGFVRTEHGWLPVPAPATAELARGMPLVSGPDGELLTPTGALILSQIVDAFEMTTPFVLEAIGYGLGSRELDDRANAVRLRTGRAFGSSAAQPTAEVVVMECEVDDLAAEGFGFLMERLFEVGVLDVYFTSVQMKKNRPGTLVTTLCRPAAVEVVAETLMRETGSLGCRYSLTQRFEAERRVQVVETAYGEVRVKLASFRGQPLAWAPEYEDCRALARTAGVSWRQVHLAAQVAAKGKS